MTEVHDEPVGATTIPPVEPQADHSTTWNWAGARWWRTDFHAHSMASFDYGEGPDAQRRKARSYTDWLLDFMRAEIDCVVIADHNTGQGIDLARAALEELQANKPTGFRPLVLIPGVEITTNGGTHITAILPEGTTAQDVQLLLGAVGYEGALGDSQTVTRESLPKVLSAIEPRGGFAVAAHADAAAGLFRQGVATIKQALGAPALIALELHEAHATNPAGILASDLPRARIAGSDSHHPTGAPGQAYPGSRYTWVKMTRPSTDGLRLALLDGPLSLIRSDAGTADPNQVPDLAIQALEISRSAYIGVQAPLRVEFNPWLNAVIGGRGTGKSTLVEFLRLALRRRSELPDAFRGEFAKYHIVQSGQEFGLLRADTTLRVEYVKEGTRFRVSWQPGRDSAIERWAGAAWEEVPGDVGARFPVRIYSQKQIFHLAGDAQALLKIVDQADPVDRRGWQETLEAAAGRFLSLRAQARELEAGLVREERLRGELDDVRRRIEVFERSDYADILREYRTRTTEAQALETWHSSWSVEASVLREMASVAIPAFPIDALDEDSASELLAAGNAATASLVEIKASLNSTADAIDAIGVRWQQALSSSEWSNRHAEARRRLGELRASLAAEGLESPREHAELLARQRQIEEDLLGLQRQRQEAIVLRDQANALLSDIEAQRSDLTRRRQAFLSDVLRDNTTVRVRVIPYGASDTIEAEFRAAIRREDQHFGRFVGRPGEDGLLKEIVPNVGRPERTEGALRALKATVRSLADGRADRSVFTDTRFVRHMEELPPEQIDRIDLWFPEDSLAVQYSPDGTGQNYVAIRQASPGQKTATLLAFLLSYGDEPMILDQPEDDLDNRLIYELIVTQVRRIKKARQLIIVTHNPNIVVVGDAELVIAMRSSNARGEVEQSGSLQDGSVRDLICHVMEGGQDAFAERYRRIGLRTR
jgi:hypothetical protein